MCLAIPGIADAADGFAEADSEINDSLQTLRVNGGEPVAVG